MARKMVFQVSYFVEVDPDAWASEYGTQSDNETRLMISQNLEAWSPDFTSAGKWRTVNANIPAVNGKPFVHVKPMITATGS